MKSLSLIMDSIKLEISNEIPYSYEKTKVKETINKIEELYIDNK